MTNRNTALSWNRVRPSIILGLAALALISCGGRKARITPVTSPAPPDPPAESSDREPPSPVAKSQPESSPGEYSESAPPVLDRADRDRDLRPEIADFRRRILETALRQIGTPYRWGGAEPSVGFDCSGLVSWTFAQSGIQIPRLTEEQFRFGQPIPRDQLAPGDLIFYAWGKNPRKVTHVGIYLGNGEYVHAPGSGKRVRRADAFDDAHRKRFLGARRVPAPFALDSRKAGETAPDEDLRTYRVRAGDYIWSIARRFNVSPFLLLKLNNLSSRDILQIGQRLLIPASK